MGTGSIGYTHIISLPALLLLAGCFGIPAATDPVEAPLNTVAAGACSESDADTKDLDASEALCLRELGTRASRTGHILLLKLDNGMTKTFRSDPEACKRDDAGKCVTYHLVGFHPASGRYLVYVQGYEDHECRLVSARTGKVTKLVDVPHFAPDGSTFFVTGYDNEYLNRIGIGSIASDPPALTWEKRQKGALNDHEEWQFVRWIDNDQVALRNTVQSGSCPQGDCEAILKRTGNSWAIENLPPKSGAK